MDLLHEIFADLREDEWLELCLISRDKQPMGRMFFNTVDELLAEAQKYSGQHHCFFGVAPRRTKSSTKEAVSRLTCVWAETDAKDFGNDKSKALVALDSFPLPWSAIVDSGHGYHGYLFLTDDLAPQEGEVVVKAVRDLVGGDNVFNCNRLLRIPGTLNIKDDEPLPCTVIEQAGHRYPAQDVVIIATKLRAVFREAINTGRAPKFAKDKSRTGADWSVKHELIKLGVSRETRDIIWLNSTKPIGEKAREDPGYNERTEAKLEKKHGASSAAISAAAAEFLEVNDCWLSASTSTILSTFVFIPERMIRGTGRIEDYFVGTMRSGGKVWENVRLPRCAFVRPEAFSRYLLRMEWQWFGKESELKKLLPFLVARWMENGASIATATEVIGRHGDLWVADCGTFTATEMLDPKDAPIIYDAPERVHPEQTFVQPPSEEEFTNLLEQLADLLPTINRPTVAYPVLGWFMAAPFKPLFNAFADPVRFPYLNLYGTKGSGKSSTVLKCYLPLLGVANAQSHNCATTEFVSLSLMDSTNAVPVSLTEFRRSSLSQRAYENLKRLLLMAYDYGKDARGRANQTTKEYTLSAPIVLDGEDVLDDPAIKDRTIFCNFSPETTKEGTAAWLAFNACIQLNLEWFALPYIQWSLTWTPERLHPLWKDCEAEVTRVFGRDMSDRVRRNLATVFTGLRLFQQFVQAHGVDTGLVTADVLSEVLAEVHDDVRGRAPIAVDAYIEEMVNYIVVSSDPQFVCKYDSDAHVLWFNNTSAYNWWCADRRRRGQGVLELAAIKAQLKELMMEEGNPGPGKYILKPKPITLPGGVSSHMHGLDLRAARNAGLDVTDTLNLSQVLLNLDVNR